MLLTLKFGTAAHTKICFLVSYLKLSDVPRCLNLTSKYKLDSKVLVASGGCTQALCRLTQYERKEWDVLG